MKWIVVEPIITPTKTKAFRVLTKEGAPLGYIRFFPRWRKFSFYPDPYTLYETDCLRDIANFCEAETRAWREGIKSRNNSDLNIQN